MIALAFDENLNNDILRGLLRRNPYLDLVRIQDAGLSGKTDDVVLEWAAQQDRVLIHMMFQQSPLMLMSVLPQEKKCPASLKSLVQLPFPLSLTISC